MKIIDSFLFFNELELLDIRLHTLSQSVDKFILSESTKTFSGLDKPLNFENNRSQFKKYLSKIEHHIVDDTPDDFSKWSAPIKYFTPRDVSFPQKSGGKPLQELNLTFQREVYQRDSIIHPLLKVAEDDDIILSSDLDEIPNPALLPELKDIVQKGTLYHFQQKWFMYFLNVHCDQEWFGTRACKFSYVKERSVDLLRYHTEDRAAQTGSIIENAGWHFSFLGGAVKVQEKLAAYDYQGRRTTPLIKILNRMFPNRIQRKLDNNQDIFLDGRTFRTINPEDHFPLELLNAAKQHPSLIKT